MTPDPTELRALAYVVRVVRPDWDEPGILAALRESRRPFRELASTALHAALDPGARTPAVIASRGPCAAVPPCPAPLPEPFDPALRHRPADPDTRARAIADARALIRQATPSPEETL